jgi:ParB family chromosome partitioning protein
VDGSLHIERGFVRPEDEPVEVAEDADAEADEGASGEDRIGEIAANDNVVSAEERPDEEDPDDLLRPLSDSLVTDLTAHRTLALRDAVASSPMVAFAAILHALVLETFYTCATSGSCLGIA